MLVIFSYFCVIISNRYLVLTLCVSDSVDLILHYDRMKRGAFLLWCEILWFT